jgi:biopolymer transport protein ExbD
MRIRDFRADDSPEINLIPLIDVVLCLIIFFVVTTTFDARSVLRLELPRADGKPNEAQSNALSVLINADGRYFVQDRESLRGDVDSLKRTIVAVAGPDRDRSVLLRADARTRHQAVVTALDALGQLGFRHIAIATAPEPPQSGDRPGKE